MSQLPFLSLDQLLHLGDDPTETQALDAVRQVVPACEIQFNDGRMSTSASGLAILCRAVLSGRIKGNPVTAIKLLRELRQPMPGADDLIPAKNCRAIYQAMLDGQLKGDRNVARKHLRSLD